MEYDKRYKIYAYVNKNNGKMYIGQTCNSLRDRSGKNGNLYKQCVLFSNAIMKYGWDSFIPIVLIDGLNKDAADYFEIELIKEFDTTNPKYGYNISQGGAISPNNIDITGQRFGKLLAIELIETGKRGRYWKCVCDCGKETISRQDHLRNGTTTACRMCNPGGTVIKPNEAIEIDNKIKVILDENDYFVVDADSYNVIKDFRWYRDKKYGNIINSKTGINILYYLFPFLKRQKSCKYIKLIDSNNSNYTKDNLILWIPKDISEKEWRTYLGENQLKITFVNNQLKHWYNKETCKSYMNYDEAKSYIKGE